MELVINREGIFVYTFKVKFRCEISKYINWLWKSSVNYHYYTHDASLKVVFFFILMKFNPDKYLKYVKKMFNNSFNYVLYFYITGVFIFQYYGFLVFETLWILIFRDFSSPDYGFRILCWRIREKEIRYSPFSFKTV